MTGQRRAVRRGLARRRVAAILAAGLVVGAGAAATLASWNDSEWVFGGALGGNGSTTPGIGTSTFEVQQNTGDPTAAGGWVDRETAPGGALSFSVGALALTPGDSVYAPVSLRTTAGSLGAEIGLVAAVDGTTAPQATELWSLLDLRVAAVTGAADSQRPACDATAFGTAWADGAIGTASATTTLRNLAAGAGDTLHVCFEISLPDSADLLAELAGETDPAAALDALQGERVTPVWRFDATSVS